MWRICSVMTKIIIRDHVRYGGVSYKVLNYARFKSRFNDGTFSLDEYIVFSNSMFSPSDVKRSITNLARNGHVLKLQNGRARYIETGVLQQLENAYRETLWAVHAGSAKSRFALDPDEADQDAPID